MLPAGVYDERAILSGLRMVHFHSHEAQEVKSPGKWVLNLTEARLDRQMCLSRAPQLLNVTEEVDIVHQ